MNNLAHFNFETIVSLRPARPGLNVISGSVELVSVLQDLLVQFMDAEKKGLLGASLGPIYWIDSGNYFNAYQMTDSARRRGIDPVMVLRSLRIARPFTAYQYQQMLDKVPEPTQIFIDGQRQPQWKLPFVIISDLMGLFYDSEIQEEDFKRAYREFLTKLLKLKRHAIILSLLLDHEVPANRKDCFNRIVQMADTLHGRVCAEIKPTISVPMLR